MKKYILVFLVTLVISSLSAQPRRDNRPQQSGSKPIYIESHVVPSGTLNRVYITYRVPYSNLVFIKNDLNYLAGLVFRVEVTGNGGVLARESTHDKVVVNTYEETNSRTKYLEGVLSFSIETAEATVNPLVSLDNTDRQVPLRPFIINTGNIDPIVVKDSKKCPVSVGYSLVNYENAIPFDDADYKMIIPIYGIILDVINISITQNEKEIITKELQRNIFAQYDLQKCEGNITLGNNLNNNTSSLFVLEKFSNLLAEGPVQINVKNSEDSLLLSSELQVSWINKPFSLQNPKFAYQLLEVIESEEVLDRIYDEADGEYEDAIDLFWRKFDPDKKTPYNQLMDEFYARADKALKEFSTTGDQFGYISDRGKIYIKYGEPSEVDRFYSDKNEITEVWKYLSPKAQFVFVDVTGLGNYKLVN